MAPLDFLAAVLPSSGYYCVAELSSNKKEHRYVTTINELEEIANGFDASHKDAYFALASFKEAGERKADKALYLRSCFFDIDCGEGKDYPNKKQALAALVDFLQDTSLGDMGTPWVVSSGGGIHVYWPFTGDVPAETWRSAAENLKRLAKQHDFSIDPSVTADRARVLRVPGTHNYKKEKPRPVTIVMEGGTFDFEQFSSSLKDKLNGHSYVPDEFGLGARPSFASGEMPTSVKLLVDNQSFNFEPVMAGCAQIQFYVKNAADDGMEPTWRAVLSQAWCCEDGKAWGKKLSDMHPYDDERFEAKWKELNGAYSCERMNATTPGICDGCPHKGKIKNPIALGKKTNTVSEAMEIVVKDIPHSETKLDVQEEADNPKISLPTPPRGFSYGAKSECVYVKKTTQGADGEEIEKEIMILPYYLYAVDVYNMGGNEHVAHFATYKKGKPSRDVLIDTKSFAGKEETIRVLAKQNVMSADKTLDEHLYKYVRSSYFDMSLERPPIEMPQSYGWTDDWNFVYNSKLYKPDGTIKPVPVRSGLENIYRATEPKGSLKEWQKMIHMLEDKGLTDVLTLSLAGFGAPLMKLTPFKGVVLHAGSTESGTGKSLSMDINTSIWGNPDCYSPSKDTSVVALEQRLGLLRNLPLNVDEVTSKSRNTDGEWLAEFILNFPSGHGKERMEAGHNAERLNNTFWETIAYMNSNTHVVDMLTGDRAHSSEGELRRMIEFPLTNQLVFTEEQGAILNIRKTNYGVAGIAFIKWLVRNREYATDVLKQINRQVATHFAMTDDERFWQAGVVCILAGIRLAGESGVLGRTVNLGPVSEYLRSRVIAMRSIVRVSSRQAEDILFSYISENYSTFIVIDMKEKKTMLEGLPGFRQTNEVSRNVREVYGRIEKNAEPGRIIVYINQSKLRSFCSSRDFAYTDMKRQLEEKYPLKDCKKTLTADTVGGAPITVKCLRLSLPENGFDVVPPVSVGEN